MRSFELQEFTALPRGLGSRVWGAGFRVRGDFVISGLGMALTGSSSPILTWRIMGLSN